MTVSEEIKTADSTDEEWLTFRVSHQPGEELPLVVEVPQLGLTWRSQELTEGPCSFLLSRRHLAMWLEGA